MKNILIVCFALIMLLVACSAPRTVKKKTVASKQKTEQATEQSATDEGLSGLSADEAPIIEALPGRSHLQVYVEPFNKRPKDIKSQSVDYVLQKDAPKKWNYKYPYLYTGVVIDYDGFDYEDYLSSFGSPVDDYPGDAVVETQLSNNLVIVRIFSDQKPDENWFKESKSKPKYKEAKSGTKPKPKKKATPKPKKDKEPTEPKEKKESVTNDSDIEDFGDK